MKNHLTAYKEVGPGPVLAYPESSLPHVLLLPQLITVSVSGLGMRFGHQRFLRLHWLGLVLVVISVFLLAGTEVLQGTLAWICLKWCHALKQRFGVWTFQVFDSQNASWFRLHG